ncbi:unnamed protein product [Strongylus vulgaris]|uniref:DUF5641 domain-containing protein n=1 Tax=Strongylus vulgaris TaxID=40348 RepID=A0A3P7HYC5_STRVU|nr:unnamed protein product [Strongylus vulgaris]
MERSSPAWLRGSYIWTWFRTTRILVAFLHKILEQDVTLTKEISTREIQWKHITHLAPWQGGFYERLIKTVKHSLYKTLKKTILIEIEALLNRRPALYMSLEACNETIIRPIDFLHEITLSYPLETFSSSNDDPSYLPLEEQQRKNSEPLEDRLTSLRKKHKYQINRSKSTSLPRKDDCVLISDPVQLRHCWRMGRIKELVLSADGDAREAIIMLPLRRQIRRPVNLLVPLELEDICTKRDKLLQAEKEKKHFGKQPNRDTL